LHRLIGLHPRFRDPKTIAACATSVAPSSLDVRAALTAVAAATAAFLPLAEARGHISVRSAEHPSIVSILLVCTLIASLLLNVVLAYYAYQRPRRRSRESANVHIGVQTQCTYTRWCKAPRFKLVNEASS
jgi:hypothetical protein